MLVASAASCCASYVQGRQQRQALLCHLKAISYIRQNYAGKIALEQTAKMVYLSRSYFQKLFAEETGTTFFNFVIQTRIEKKQTAAPKQRYCPGGRGLYGGLCGSELLHQMLPPGWWASRPGSTATAKENWTEARVIL